MPGHRLEGRRQGPRSEGGALLGVCWATLRIGGFVFTAWVVRCRLLWLSSGVCNTK